MTILTEMLGRMVRYVWIVKRKNVNQCQKNLNVILHTLRLSCHTDDTVNMFLVIFWATAFESELKESFRTAAMSLFLILR